MQHRQDDIEALKVLMESIKDMNYHLEKVSLVMGEMYFHVLDTLAELGDPESIEKLSEL